MLKSEVQNSKTLARVNRGRIRFIGKPRTRLVYTKHANKKIFTMREQFFILLPFSFTLPQPPSSAVRKN